MEKAYFIALNREIDARQFIKEFNKGNKTLLAEPCICVDLKCKAPLEIIGKRKLFEGKNVKKMDTGLQRMNKRPIIFMIVVN